MSPAEKLDLLQKRLRALPSEEYASVEPGSLMAYFSRVNGEEQLNMYMVIKVDSSRGDNVIVWHVASFFDSRGDKKVRYDIYFPSPFDYVVV